MSIIFSPFSNYNLVTPFTYAADFCNAGVPVISYLLNIKLPENPVVSASTTTTTQVITPSAKNRYIQSVTVEKVSTKTLNVTPTSSVQTFTDGPYGEVTVQATA